MVSILSGTPIFLNFLLKVYKLKTYANKIKFDQI